jgi:3-hydroxyacyl-CoA dehydrogenase
MSTHYETRGATAVIRLASPPVNSLSHEVRTGIVAGMDRAAADPGVSAIVLIGSERAFSGGADINEFRSQKSAAEPTLLTVIEVVENSTKPVIAAIGGVCMGGGLELALGAHFRLAAPDASLALPEVKLGLLPGAGGTQRLPRLVGIETATNFIVSGDPLPAKQFEGTALVDEFVTGDLLEAALGFADRVVAEARPLKLARSIEVGYPDHEAYFQSARNRVQGVAGPFPAPLKCLEALQAAAAKPFEEGLKIERGLFVELMLSPESRALRHAFGAERAAAKIADVPRDTPVRPIARVGVIGAGTMGGGIAMNFLNAGLPVTLLETAQAALDRGTAIIRGNYASSVKRGRLTEADLEQRLQLLSGTLAYEDLADCDLVVEAVYEDLGVKETVFRRLDAVAKPGAILATNTSTLDVNAIARFTTRPADVLGMHFFSPANVMKLLEVVRGTATAKDVLATVMQLAKKIKKTAVVAGVCDGFIGNRMLHRYGATAEGLVVAGATPWQVDQALEKWGMAMGPFRVGDLAGNDIGWAIRKRRYAAAPPARPHFADRLCELGRYGQKTGKGWYLYQPGNRRAIPDPEVEALLAAFRRDLGIAPRPIGDEEIVQRCIYALVNEGARILEEGIAARASDIDLVYLSGYGFPLQRGGPMRYADEIGLPQVARTLREFAAGGDPFWEPAPLIARLVADGKSFT